MLTLLNVDFQFSVRQFARLLEIRLLKKTA
jgi:hypothetical protein